VSDIIHRRVTIVIEDADGGFHLSMDCVPPIEGDGSNVRPTPALMAGSVARRAIEELVNRQTPEAPGAPGATLELGAPPEAAN
jgi:hypothetical protein